MVVQSTHARDPAVSLFALVILVYVLTVRATRLITGALFRWMTVVLAVLMALLITGQ